MNYEVGSPIVSGTPEATADAAQAPSAIFIAHGMGQQVPFETIDAMANGICRMSGNHVTSMTARTVRVDCDTLQRLELEFDDRPPIHIYEGYWAPLTEGVIGVWEVIRFLVSGAMNGMTSGLKLRRFVNGAMQTFRIALHDVINLLFAVLVVLAIAATGTTIIVVGTARLAFKDEAWIRAVLPDLTILFEWLLLVVLTGAIVAGLLALTRMLRPVMSVVIVEAGMAFIVTAIAIVFAFMVNETPPFPAVVKGGVCPVPDSFFAPYHWIVSHGPHLRWCGDCFAFATWVILLGVALKVRRLVIEFVGDVTIYVSSHKLDRFFSVRQEIKKAVWKAARSVYAYSDQYGNPVYSRVVMAGHSLGSVVVYDALNRLLNDDQMTGGNTQCCDDAPVKPLDVRQRTRMLLTFGSPLDKTAFVFSTHTDKNRSERETLAASVQPLIAEKRPFPWVNLYSPQDIISGSLEFYGDVLNVRDPFAVTPLKAHVEYWQGTMIYDAMLQAFAEGTAQAPVPA